MHSLPIELLSESVKTIWETSKIILLSSCLQWYLVVIQSGKAFVQFLFNCTNNLSFVNKCWYSVVSVDTRLGDLAISMNAITLSSPRLSLSDNFHGNDY